MKTVVIQSGYFNPLHSGHLQSLKAAKELGDKLIVIVNNDEQVKLKGSVPFMKQEERLEIVRAIKYVDIAVLSVEDDKKTIADSLSLIAACQPNQHKLIFAKGGDRSDPSNMPEDELEACDRNNIEIIYGVGGFDKPNSSSDLINKAVLAADNPELDCTPFSHPAWDRGNGHATAVLVQIINEWFDKPNSGGVYGYKPLTDLRDRFYKLKDSKTYEDTLKTISEKFNVTVDEVRYRLESGDVF